jgi:hypothetical protein
VCRSTATIFIDVRPFTKRFSSDRNKGLLIVLEHCKTVRNYLKQCETFSKVTLRDALSQASKNALKQALPSIVRRS